MFDNRMISLFYNISILNFHTPISKNLNCYNEDSRKFENFNHLPWDQSDLINDDINNVTLRVSIPNNVRASTLLQYYYLQTVVDEIGMKIEWKPCTEEHLCFNSVFLNLSDLSLVPVGQSLKSDSLLPFTVNQYGIYYAIKDFHVSSTFFVEGLTIQLWMFTLLALFGIFIGFMIISRTYCYYFKCKWFISDVFIYQANFWGNQTVKYHWEKFLSWRILFLTGFVLNIIIMTAFSAKFVALMSIRHFEQPFNTLEDFSTIKTHSLCVSPSTIMIENFKVANNKGYSHQIDPKWNGILNTPECDDIYDELYRNICSKKNIAVALPKIQYDADYAKCAIHELNGFISNVHGSIMISNGFKHKEKFNQMYLKLRETGIIDRINKRYKLKKNLDSTFEDPYKKPYNVIKEGVMFEHVKLIVCSYFMFLVIPLIVLLIEILIHKYKYKMIRFINHLANNH